MDRATRTMVEGIRNAKYDHEIIATKGHPHSPAARKLMAERAAAGKPLDGSKR